MNTPLHVPNSTTWEEIPLIGNKGSLIRIGKEISDMLQLSTAHNLKYGDIHQLGALLVDIANMTIKLTKTPSTLGDEAVKLALRLGYVPGIGFQEDEEKTNN